jgi:DNA-binding MarR family transcriptional regulator
MLDTQGQDERTNEIAGLIHDRVARLARQLRHMDLPNGMTPERLSALSAIIDNGPIAVTALAEREMVRPATMSRMVSTLVGDGLARRLENKDDGRGVLVVVTAKGRRAHQRAQQLRLQQLGTAIGSLEPDRIEALEDFVGVLTLLTDSLDS